jgi:nitrite reductase/ring-hydroxylating ferredoxin subunit
MGLRTSLRDAIKALVGRGDPSSPKSGAPAAAAPRSDARRALPTAADAEGWRALAFAEQVVPGKGGTFPLPAGAAASGIVAVFRHDGRLWCIDNACTHEDGPVGEGAVTGCKVRCPYHDWEFDFTTGACVTDPERPLATWSVRERDGVIWVGPRLTEGTAHRGGDHNDGLETIVR